MGLLGAFLPICFAMLGGLTWLVAFVGLFVYAVKGVGIFAINVVVLFVCLVDFGFANACACNCGLLLILMLVVIVLFCLCGIVFVAIVGV